MLPKDDVPGSRDLRQGGIAEPHAGPFGAQVRRTWASAARWGRAAGGAVDQRQGQTSIRRPHGLREEQRIFVVHHPYVQAVERSEAH